MKNLLKSCAFTLGLLAIYPTGAAAEISVKHNQTDSVKTDLICKMKVKPSTKHKSTFQKQEYLFCSERCKLKFEQNPVKYIKK